QPLKACTSARVRGKGSLSVGAWPLTRVWMLLLLLLFKGLKARVRAAAYCGARCVTGGWLS
ncbi:MAG TPA: hypothetical protein VEE84_10080, partial [Burkholderiaceae bacterium]|nr:hypothetical protein [Burkholderiaceae bacterium]